MPKFKRIAWISYLVVLHGALLFGIAMIPGIRARFQMEKRIPGSRLYTLYDNRPDEWMRFIMHDDRDPVIAIIDYPYGVGHIQVAPPGSQFVWSFDRDEGEYWKLYIADFGTAQRAASHLQDPDANHFYLDGYPIGGIDGFPDREAIIEGDVKRTYQIDPPTKTLLREVPYSVEP